jgi:hypothetical protein
MPSLKEYAISGTHSEKLRRSTNGSATPDLFALFEKHCKAAFTRDTAFFPSDIYDHLMDLGDRLDPNMQNDAQECLNLFIEELQTASIRADHLADNCWELKHIQHRDFQNTFLFREFGCYLSRQMQCNHCSKKGGINEQAVVPLNFCLPLTARRNSLDELLMDYFGDTYREQWKCEQCKKLGGINHLSYSKLPQTLIVTLGKFRWNDHKKEARKVRRTIKYSDQLDLEPYLDESAKGSSSSHKYNLCAVVCHEGETANSGHYVCYAQSASKIWHCFDDDKKPQRVDGSHLSHKNAYLLFYNRMPGTEEKTSEPQRNSDPEQRTASQQCSASNGSEEKTSEPQRNSDPEQRSASEQCSAPNGSKPAVVPLQAQEQKLARMTQRKSIILDEAFQLLNAVKQDCWKVKVLVLASKLLHTYSYACTDLWFANGILQRVEFHEKDSAKSAKEALHWLKQNWISFSKNNCFCGAFCQACGSQQINGREHKLVGKLVGTWDDDKKCTSIIHSLHGPQPVKLYYKQCSSDGCTERIHFNGSSLGLYVWNETTIFPYDLFWKHLDRAFFGESVTSLHKNIAGELPRDQKFRDWYKRSGLSLNMQKGLAPALRDFQANMVPIPDQEFGCTKCEEIKRKTGRTTIILDGTSMGIRRERSYIEPHERNNPTHVGQGLTFGDMLAFRDAKVRNFFLALGHFENDNAAKEKACTKLTVSQCREFFTYTGKQCAYCSVRKSDLDASSRALISCDRVILHHPRNRTKVDIPEGTYLHGKTWPPATAKCYDVEAIVNLPFLEEHQNGTMFAQCDVYPHRDQVQSLHPFLRHVLYSMCTVGGQRPTADDPNEDTLFSNYASEDVVVCHNEDARAFLQCLGARGLMLTATQGRTQELQELCNRMSLPDYSQKTDEQKTHDLKIIDQTIPCLSTTTFCGGLPKSPVPEWLKPVLAFMSKRTQEYLKAIENWGEKHVKKCGENPIVPKLYDVSEDRDRLAGCWSVKRYRKQRNIAYDGCHRQHDRTNPSANCATCTKQRSVSNGMTPGVLLGTCPHRMVLFSTV